METPKTFFNYRVILDADETENQFYSIRGVHYEDFGKTIVGWDSEPLTMVFDQGDSMSAYLNNVERATQKPVLRVEGNELKELGERPAEMFVGREGNFPAVEPTNITSE